MAFPSRTTGTVSFIPIGVVHNGFPLGTPSETMRAGESRIVLEPELAEGLQDLEQESKVLVVFHFHQSSGFELLQHPKGDTNRPKRGVFALRSPRRPNAIGVTEAELMDITENVLVVRGLDAIEGTPVLDLKPV
jgi:formylmethanofuran dehydrogenase subunit E